MSSLDVAWCYSKANTLADAWRVVVGDLPPTGGLVLALSVAVHETRAGDAWPGEHNWGAVQARSLSSAELAVLVNLPPSPANVSAARAALDQAVMAHTIPPLVGVGLHVDSSPRFGWYWVFFRAFATDEEGAEVFVRTLAASRPACRSVLDRATGTDQDTFDLASAMYASGYYEGIHDPRAPEGKAENVRDYVAALDAVLPTLRSRLATWTPGASPPAPATVAVDLCTPEGVQAALNACGSSLVVDGKLGPKSRAAIKAFQFVHDLTADGRFGPKTRAAMVTELTTRGVSFSSDCGTTL